MRRDESMVPFAHIVREDKAKLGRKSNTAKGSRAIKGLTWLLSL